MVFAEFFVDQTGFLEVGDEGNFDPRDASHDESSEGAIVKVPDAVGLWTGDRIGAREAAIEPLGEALVICQIFQAEAPLRPVGFAQIEDEIGRPQVIRQEAFGDGDVIRVGGITRPGRVGIRSGVRGRICWGATRWGWIGGTAGVVCWSGGRSGSHGWIQEKKGE